MAVTPNPARRVGIDALVVHVLLPGSYASTVANPLLMKVRPPTAYSVPLMAATPSPSRGVAIDAFVVHVLLPGSYASTVAKQLPPSSSGVPLIAANPNTSP